MNPSAPEIYLILSYRKVSTVVASLKTRISAKPAADWCNMNTAFLGLGAGADDDGDPDEDDDDDDDAESSEHRSGMSFRIIWEQAMFLF